MKLSVEENIRYARHLNLPDFGLETQEKLKASRVLVVGAGGLGAPLLQYLTAAGIGTIGVVDFDTVEVSNLQRQVLFGTSDVGKAKTAVAIQKLRDQNPHVRLVEHDLRLDSKNAMDIIGRYDVVADGTDNFPTRYLVNDACVLLDKPFVYGAISQYEGQVSVFNYQDCPNYRDLFPSPPFPGEVPSCAEGGVLGVLPGIIGSMQATEVIKVVTGMGETLAGRLFLFDALDFTSRIIHISKNADNPISGPGKTINRLIDYEKFCNSGEPSRVRSITVDELRNWREEKKTFTLIDVREPYEHEAGKLSSQLIPMAELETYLDRIPRIGDVVFYCRSGSRSAKAIQMLETKHGYTNLINLEGGMQAWRERIDKGIVVV